MTDSAFSLLRLAAPSLVHESCHGVSWVAVYSVHTCHGLRPRGATRPGRCVSTGHGLVFRVDFHHFDSVVLSQVLISGLNPFNLLAYGLHACHPTHRVRNYSLSLKDWLPGGGLLTGAGLTPARIRDLAQPHRNSISHPLNKSANANSEQKTEMTGEFRKS